MDPEFPKTVNAAVSVAGKVHGSLSDLETLIAELKTHLGELTLNLAAALSAMKAVPEENVMRVDRQVIEPVPEPEPVVEPEPVTESKEEWH
jgi:hypothetical protein